MVFLKEFFETVDFERIQKMIKKNAKFPSMLKFKVDPIDKGKIIPGSTHNDIFLDFQGFMRQDITS